jgi:hypothetical protein
MDSLYRSTPLVVEDGAKQRIARAPLCHFHCQACVRSKVESTSYQNFLFACALVRCIKPAYAGRSRVLGFGLSSYYLGFRQGSKIEHIHLGPLLACKLENS